MDFISVGLPDPHICAVIIIMNDIVIVLLVLICDGQDTSALEDIVSIRSSTLTATNPK